MPNWATGTLKIGGTKENILRFCREKLDERANYGQPKNEFDPKVEWALNEGDDEEIVATVHGEQSFTVWLRDSQRNFVEMDSAVPYYWDLERVGNDAYRTAFELWKLPEGSNWCVVFPVIAAWGVDEQYYADQSKEYGLTFRVYTVEQGMGFFSEFIAKDGKAVMISHGPSTKEGESNEQWYGRFIWECPFPFLGG